MNSVDAVVIGGGVIGCAVAYNLAKAGVLVALVERDDICAGTSVACDTAIHLQSKSPGLHLRMAQESIKLFPELQKDFDEDIHFKNTGTMIAIQTREQYEVMRAFAERQRNHGLDVVLLDRAAAVEKQPMMKGDVVGATYCTADATIHPQFLTKGYFQAAKKYGAKAMLHTKVENIVLKDGHVASVITNRGNIPCKYVVNACGAYAPFIGKMAGLDIPIAPRRGQIVVTEPMPKFTHTIVNCARYIAAKFRPDLLGTSEADRMGIGLSLTQTERGNLLIGGTREFVGYDTRTTQKALMYIIQHATSILPALKDIHIIRTFAGLRPFTPDGLPILGNVPGIEGFVMAAGHEGDGLALSAITGRLIAEIICEKPSAYDFDLTKLSLERYKNLDIKAFEAQYAVCK